MAHFAELDANNVVLRVIVVADKDTATAEGVEQEWIGQAFCVRLFGGTWKKTSYNGNMRKNYAGIGFTYDSTRDAFIPPMPTDGTWMLNEETCQWERPIPQPKDGKVYNWDEATQSWVEVVAP